MHFLKKYGLSYLNDYDAFFDLFYDGDIRFEFMLAFKKVTRCLNLLFPSRYALDYLDDFKALTEIYVLAGKHFRESRLSMRGIPQKLRSITDSYLESRGIEQKVKLILILDEDFQKQVEKRSRTKTKAAEVEHAIRDHLEVELEDDPDLQASFFAALAELFIEFKDNSDKIYEEFKNQYIC